MACVIPLFKNGEANKINNYRPVSWLSTLSKVFEKIVYKYVYNFFLDNNRNNSIATRFLEAFSMITQLIELQYTFAKALDDQKDTRTVFLYVDISKASTGYATMDSYVS